jgi:hypothetical protein
MEELLRGTLEAIKFGIPRSSKWHSVRQKHLEKEPKCLVCGTRNNLQVHHIFPFHYCVILGRSDLEFDQRNLVTLCEEKGRDHHLLIGHLNNFRSSNLNVKKDIIKFSNMSENKIKKDANWQNKELKRLIPLDKMTEKDKKEFTELMNKTYPLIN